MTRGKMILAALGCVLLPLAILGAGKPDIGLNRGTSVGLSSALGDRGVAKVDTFRVWSRVTAFPNSAAKLAGYITARDTVGATINSGNSGEAVRWGWVLKSAPTTVQKDAGDQNYFIGFSRQRAEDNNASWPADGQIGFLWFSANGLKRGDKIESAYIMFNTALWETFTVPAGQTVTARLDTVSLDYRIMAGTAPGTTDVARFDATWNELNDTANLAWSPTLDSRLDMHDFGPLAGSSIGPGTYPAGTCLRIDVTDAVQQAADNGTLSRGLIFVVYGSSGSGQLQYIAAGNHAGRVSGGKGCPTFTATATSRRGVQPWGGVRVPVCLTFDDSYPIQTTYFTALRDSGKTFDEVICRNAAATWYASSWVDTINTAHPGEIQYIVHSKTHTSLGQVTGTALNPEVGRQWFPSLFTVDPDTTVLLDFAWPSNGGSPLRSIEATSKIIDWGYRSARGFGNTWTPGDAGAEYNTYLAWSGYVNKYMIQALDGGSLFGSGGGAATNAQLEEALTDLIDTMYSYYGKSAIVLYIHSSLVDYLNDTNLRYFIGLTNRLNSCQIVPYRTAIDQRLSGATVLQPGAIMEYVSPGVYTQMMRGIGPDSNKVQTLAARQDSIYEAGSNANLLQMWLGPK